jgi:hypothetical protein
VGAPAEPDEAFSAQFEKHIRDIASRAVAHVKRGDAVVVKTTSGQRVRADKSVGADPILRFLALIEPVPRASLPAKTPAVRLPQVAIPAGPAANSDGRAASPTSAAPTSPTSAEAPS